MEWLCPACETINSLKNSNGKEEQERKYFNRNNFCKTCFMIRDDYKWLTYIGMNKEIDKYIPRYTLDVYISQSIVALIHHRSHRMDDTYEYIKTRIRYRNAESWAKWRRNILYKRIILKILSQWNKQYDEQLEYSLILPYLL